MVDLKDSIYIADNFTMSLSSDTSARNATTVKPNDEEKKNAQLEVKAKLHFKDGRILERLLSNNLPNTLFTQTYYKLIDDIRGQTYIFKARQDSAISETQFVDYDEIMTEKNSS